MVRWQKIENYQAVRVDYTDKAPASIAELENYSYSVVLHMSQTIKKKVRKLRRKKNLKQKHDCT